MNHEEQRTILIVDDDTDIAALLEAVLRHEGFLRVFTAASASEGLERYRSLRPDLVLLDIMLPDGNGYELFKAMQEIHGSSILFISAKDEELDRLLGFALGADDYITKPFSAKEVAYRVKARLRGLTIKRAMTERGHGGEERKHRFGDMCLDPDAGELTKAGVTVELSAKEFRLLLYFLEHPGRVLSKEMICQNVWGEKLYGSDNTITVHIRKLRLKIEDDPSNPRWIQTIVGLGYRFNVEKADA